MDGARGQEEKKMGRPEQGLRGHVVSRKLQGSLAYYPYVNPL